MIEQLLGGLKGQIGGDLQQKAGVDSSMVDDILKITGNVATQEVGKEMLGGNLGSVMNLFSNNSNNAGANSLQSNITNGISSALVSQLGLKKETANMVVGIVIPVVMNMVTQKNGETADDDASPLEAIFGAGGKQGGPDVGKLLGGLSGLLGGK